MRTISLKEDDIIYSQEIIDSKHNVFIRIYKVSESSYGFRFVKISNSKEEDPFANKVNFKWAYGPITHFKQIKTEAIQFYLKLIQK